MATKAKQRRPVSAITAIGFCRSDDQMALDRQSAIIRAYAHQNGITLPSVITQQHGPRMSTASIEAVVEKRPPGVTKCLLLIVDLSRLTRRGFEDHMRVRDRLKAVGFEIRATGSRIHVEVESVAKNAT